MISSRIASLEARIARLESRLTKKAGAHVSNPLLVQYQIKMFLREGKQLEGLEVKALSPLPPFTSTHVIRLECIDQDGNSVVLDLHCSENVIVEQSFNIFDHMYNTKLAYGRSNANLGVDFSGEDLNEPSTVKRIIFSLKMKSF